ncbi:MAG: CAP domain-containing protein [Rhizomicrobium sp.]
MRVGARRPHCLNRLTLLAIAFAAISTAASAQTSPSHNLPPPCQAEQDFAKEAEILIAQQIDAERAKLAPGAPALRRDETLSRIAELRSCEMVQGGKPLSHLDDKGHFESADIVFSVFGLYGSVAENLMQMTASAGGRLAGAREFASQAVDLWMKSPEHRPHILDPDYDRSGIGVAMVGGNAVATQVFHGPSHNAPPCRTAERAQSMKARTPPGGAQQTACR